MAPRLPLASHTHSQQQLESTSSVENKKQSVALPKSTELVADRYHDDLMGEGNDTTAVPSSMLGSSNVIGTNAYGGLGGAALGYGSIGAGGFGSLGAGGFGFGGPMMPSPYMGGGIGPLASLNQFLFGVQNVIFSLSQALQIVGMNSQALQQLLESATAMCDHVLASIHELLEPKRNESPAERKRRRRLRALRWAFVTAVTYAGYKLLRALRQRHMRKIITNGQPPLLPMHSDHGYGHRVSYGSYPPPHGYPRQMQPYPSGAMGHYGSQPYGAGPGVGFF